MQRGNCRVVSVGFCNRQHDFRDRILFIPAAAIAVQVARNSFERSSIPVCSFVKLLSLRLLIKVRSGAIWRTSEKRRLQNQARRARQHNGLALDRRSGAAKSR
jgi:hypothetical protein